MKSYLKEILLSLASLLVLSLVITAYFKAMKEEKERRPDALYTLVPPNVRTLMAINRPYLFHEMILRHPALHPIFAAEIPEVFLSLLAADRPATRVVISFHPQGTLCCVQTDSRTAGWITEKYLPERFKSYSPQKQTGDGIDFYYYPDTGNRFFGYYVHRGIWVGSYSSKLLERAAGQQLKGEIQLPDGMDSLCGSFDTNAPLNLISPAGELGIDRAPWLSADFFVSEGTICCHGRLPYDDAYESVGDTLSRRITEKYPSLRVTFQMSREEDALYYTGCIDN
jgi:hypothetical protein